MKRSLIALGSVALCVGACADPVSSDLVDGLGEEPSGIDTGPLHRPGQPCLPCHNGDGEGNLVFSMAGTVYKEPDSGDPLPNAIVHIADSAGNRYRTGTNCAGNFFVQADDFTPQYPAWAWIEFGGVLIAMNSPIFREGSCAGCHASDTSEVSAGRVYFSEVPLDYPATGCP